jgi:hypothetical protein
MIGPGLRAFPKHPLSFTDPDTRTRAAKTMLMNNGKMVGKVWAIDHESIAYTNTHQQPVTAYIIRTEADDGWTISPVSVTGWPITT